MSARAGVRRVMRSLAPVALLLLLLVPAVVAAGGWPDPNAALVRPGVQVYSDIGQ